MLREINRITVMNGYFVIREHDAFTNNDYMLCDIEHAMWDVVRRQDTKFYDNFYSKYYNWIEWDIILDHYGFQYVHAGYDSTRMVYEVSATRYYYAIYKKVKNIKSQKCEM